MPPGASTRRASRIIAPTILAADLVQQIVGDDQVERRIGEAQRRAAHLVKDHAHAERLRARVRVAQHAGADVDGVHFGMSG